jgi:hypothetical protein
MAWTPTEITVILGFGCTVGGTLIGGGITWGVFRTLIKNNSNDIEKTSKQLISLEKNFSACQLRSVQVGTQANETMIVLSKTLTEYSSERKILARDLQDHREEVIGRLSTLEALIRNGGKA